MAGKTMLSTAVFCALTDQRGFSNDRAAASRIHSEAKIDLVNPGIVDQRHTIGETVQVGCRDGTIVCQKRSPVPSDMKFSWIGISSDKELMVKVKASQGPGCPANAAIKKTGQFLLDGKIDYEGTFFIKRSTRGGKPLKNYLDLGFLGRVDLFPAYEFVVQLNDAIPIHLGGVLPKPGSSPITHIGTSQKVHFVRRLWLNCKDGKQTSGIAERIIN